MTKLDLETRTGLPDALRVLVDDLPRAAWAQHPDFHGLVSFWLDRHLMFRKLMDHMAVETEAMLDKRRDPVAFAQGVARYGGMFVEQLHGHHQIEDQHYFPLLAQRDVRIVAGFDLLDADHHALDGHIARFVEGAWCDQWCAGGRPAGGGRRVPGRVGRYAAAAGPASGG